MVAFCETSFTGFILYNERFKLAKPETIIFIGNKSQQYEPTSA